MNQEEKKKDESDRTVVLKIFTNEIDAELAVEYLKNHQVDAFLTRKYVSWTGKHEGIRLMVRESDTEKATEILRSMEEGDST
ncbi:hypothetical protein ACFLS9_08855 [Bacteroidota bacterium]